MNYSSGALPMRAQLGIMRMSCLEGVWITQSKEINTVGIISRPPKERTARGTTAYETKKKVASSHQIL